MHQDRIESRPVSPALGAEVGGCDLSRPLDDGAFEAILGALLRYQVLVFRDQTIGEAEQIAFSRRFGEIQIHVLNQYVTENPEVFVISNLDENDEPTGEHPDPGAMIWHTDGSWASVPGYVTMLYAIEIPERSGDTDFANTSAAYDALDDATKRRIEGMRVVQRPERFTPPLGRRRPDDRGAAARGAPGRTAAGPDPSADRAEGDLSRRTRLLRRRHAGGRGPRLRRRHQPPCDPPGIRL